MSENFNPSVILSHTLRGESVFFNARYPTFSNREFQVLKEQLMLDDKLRVSTPSNAIYFSLVNIVCPCGICKAIDENGSPIYKDENHMRPAFVKEVVGPHFMKIFE